MASFYSKPADYGTYTQAIDLDLVNFVLGSKQQKYDYNLAKVESKVKDQLGSIDLERTQDKEYFLNKASDVLASIGDLSKMDWSKNGVTRQVDAQLNAVVDDRVLNDTISTRNYRSFQRELQTKQEKNPELYSATNAAYAMKKYGVNDWLQGKSGSVGTINYEDFTDVGAELKGISENLDKFARVYKRQTPSGDGAYWVTEGGKQLTSSEVRAIAEAQLSTKAKNQMRIDGWANYDGGVRSQEDIKADFNRFKEMKIQSADTSISNIDLQIASLDGSNSKDLESLKDQKQQWEEYKRGTSDKFNDWLRSGSIDNMTTTMQNETVLNNFGNTFSINDITESSIKANEYKLADYTHRLKMEEIALKVNLTNSKEKVDKTAFRNDLQTFDRTLQKGDPGYSEVNFYDKTTKDVMNFSNQYRQSVQKAFNSLDDKAKAAIEKDWAENGKKSGATRELFIENKIESLSSGESALVPEATLAEITRNRLRRDNAVNMREKAQEEAFNRLENKGLDNFVEELSDNKYIKIMNEDGNIVNGEAFFRDHGIKSVEDLRNNESAKNTLMKSYYADKFVNSIEPGVWEKIRSGVFSYGMAPIDAFAMDIKNRSEESDLYNKRLVQLFDGDEAKASEFLLEAKKRGIGTDTARVMDDTVTDDSALNNFVTYNGIKTEAGNYMAETGSTTTLAGVIVPGTGQLAEELMNVVTAPGAGLTGSKVPKFAKGMSLTIADLGDGTVQIGFTKEQKGVAYADAVIVPKANIPADILGQINFDEQAPLFTKENMQEISTHVKMLDEGNLKKISNMAAMYGQPPAFLIDMVTKQGLSTIIRKNFGSMVGTKQNPTEMGTAINKMLDDDNIFVDVVKTNNGFVKQISHIDPSKHDLKTVLYSSKLEIPEDEYEASYFNTKFVPQLEIFQAITNGLILTQESGEENPDSIISNIMDLYGE